MKHTRPAPDASAPTRRTLLAATAASLLAGCAEPFFFHPNRTVYSTRGSLGVRAEDVFFDSDGLRLHGWWMPALGPARATLVHLHGNAANVSNHARQVAWLPAERINVLTFDYRGFGLSHGSPSLDGVVDDARAAIAEARRRSAAPLVVYGQSLGGSTAVRAAAEETAGDIRLLVVESAFASYRRMVRDSTRHSVLALLAPLAPLAASTLPRHADDPAQAMARVRMPVLLLHGDSDRVVPIEHSERLHAAAQTPKRFIRIPGGRHLDALQRDDIRRAVLDAILGVL